jgi:hypothetical protein
VAFACGLYFPWWTIAVAAFIAAIAIAQKPLAAFLSGFIALFLLWFCIAVAINSANEGVLAPKISSIMGLGGSSFMLIIITSILGAIVGGMGALTGSLMMKLK